MWSILFPILCLFLFAFFGKCERACHPCFSCIKYSKRPDFSTGSRHSTHLLIGHRYPAADAALESTDYLTRLDAYTFHEGFAHLLSYQATEIDCVDWHTPQLTEVAAASRAKLRLALMETDPDRQKQFLEEAVCGSYYEKFACMCGMLYLAGRWETQGIDGLKSAFADYHGFAQRALSIRI